MMKFVWCLFLGLGFLSAGGIVSPAYAQTEKLTVNKSTALFIPNIQHINRSKDEFVKLQNVDLPIEPQFKQVRFLKQVPPKTLNERIERLIYGMKIDIPPEYDHYGYEIRRYMKSILNPNDLNDSLRIPEMLKNARTARLILDYWKKHLSDESKIIEEELAKTRSNHALIANYKYNQGVVNAFIPDMYVWIDNNIEFLEYIQEIGGEYYVSYPFYEISSPNLKERFFSLYERREKGLNNVIAYAPFSMMIY